MERNDGEVGWFLRKSINWIQRAVSERKAQLILYFHLDPLTCQLEMRGCWLLFSHSPRTGRKLEFGGHGLVPWRFTLAAMKYVRKAFVNATVVASSESCVRLS